MTLRRSGSVLLILLTACTSTTRLSVQGTPPDYTPETHWYEVDVVEPGTVSTRPVHVDRGEFQQALRRLARDMPQGVPPKEAARTLLKTKLEMEGDWLVEVNRGRVLTLVPQDDKGPLTPLEEKALRDKYNHWCQTHGGGDCLDLYGDGPYLRADDRRTLALALAFGSVLEESREALVHELDPKAAVATFAWALTFYCGMWAMPELSSKGAAAVITVALVGWLGLDAVWGLMDGWAHMANRAHEARTFAELREAGEQFAKVIGKDAARALVLAVGSLTGRTMGEVASRVRTLPGYETAVLQAEAQNLRLAVALETVETVVAAPEGALAVAMLSRNHSASATPAPQGPTVTSVLRHRKGNQQVELSNGQRWHLPRGMSPRDIPASDPLGDELQAAANQIANQWGPHRLTTPERQAIDRALNQGEYFQASRLQGQARGRWVEAQLREQFPHLKWEHHGVDIKGPKGYDYEVLAGSADNFGRHGRRMSNVFFRMIFF